MPKIVYIKYIASLKAEEKVATKWVKLKQSLSDKIVTKIILVGDLKSQTVE